MRNNLIVSNWKLNGTKNTITKSLTILSDTLSNISKCHIAIAPPLVYLDTARNCLLNNRYHTHISLCAQNIDINLSGAFTGEISALMLQDLNVKYVLIGHSERRIHHQENNLYIAKKFSIIKKVGLIPILCIGENKIEYDSNATQTVCIQQIDTIIKTLGIQAFHNSIIAYEPIWAIGTGVSASPEQVQLIHKNIRHHLAQYNTKIASQIIIQYGGSVNLNNALQFITQQDIDGILIGSASLDINNFLAIIQLINKAL